MVKVPTYDIAYETSQVRSSHVLLSYYICFKQSISQTAIHQHSLHVLDAVPIWCASIATDNNRSMIWICRSSLQRKWIGFVV